MQFIAAFSEMKAFNIQLCAEAERCVCVPAAASAIKHTRALTLGLLELNVHHGKSLVVSKGSVYCVERL